MQGRFLDKICQDRPELAKIIQHHVLEHYQVELEHLPSWEDDPKAASAYDTKLSRDYMKFGVEDPFYTRGHEPHRSTPKEGGDNHELVSQLVYIPASTKDEAASRA